MALAGVESSTQAYIAEALSTRSSRLFLDFFQKYLQHLDDMMPEGVELVTPVHEQPFRPTHYFEVKFVIAITHKK